VGKEMKTHMFASVEVSLLISLFFRHLFFQQKQQSFAFQGQNNQQAQPSNSQQSAHVGRFLQQQQFSTNNTQGQSTPTNRQF